MKVLIYGNRKTDDLMYDISSPEKESAAYLKLFRLLDEDWKVYQNLTAKEKELYDQAKAGDAQAAKKLTEKRRSYEYEEFRIGEVEDPLAA